MGVDKLTNEYVQSIVDGNADASTLSIVVNGDDKTDVMTRLGERYPTVKKAIKIMTQAGVGFTTFETKAEMIASPLTNSSYAIVTNDTTSNNGLHLKKLDEWFKVTYDVDYRQKEYADAARDSAISTAETYTTNELSALDTININSGKTYPLIYLKRSETATDSQNQYFVDALLDAQIINAERDYYYKLSYLQNGEVITGVSKNYGIIIERINIETGNTIRLIDYADPEKQVKPDRAKGGVQNFVLQTYLNTYIKLTFDVDKLPPDGTAIIARVETNFGYNSIIDPATYIYEPTEIYQQISDVDEAATTKASDAKTQAVAIATDLAADDATRKTNELSAITKAQFVDKNSVNSELYSDSNSLLMMKDKEGKPYLFVDKDAGLQLTGLDSTVQQNLSTLKSQTSSNSNVSVLDLIDADDNLVAQITSEDIKIVSAPNGIVNFIETVSQRLPTTENVDFKITGKDDQVVAVFSQEGDLEINAIPDGIANRVNIDFLNKQLKESSNDAKYDLHQSALSKITTLKMQTGLQAPIPIGCVPLDFTPPNALLSEMIVQPESRTVIDTPYGVDDGVVHPHIIQFADTFNHKKYWLGLTPYYLNQDKFENPVIYGSDNLDEFVMFGDYPQPLSENPPAPIGYKGAYNSDIFHFYDFNTGDLCCGWRLTEDKLPTGREVSLLYRRTKDGINWSESEVLMPKELGDIALSPSVIYDFNAKKYYLYVVTGATGGGFKLSRYETNRIGGSWTNITACTGLDSTGLTAWHADVRYLGDKIVALIQDNSVAQNLCLGMSSDGLTFTTSNPLLIGDYLKPYKATLTCTTNDAGQIALNYIWTSNEKSSNADDRWRLYTQQTNFVNII